MLYNLSPAMFVLFWTIYVPKGGLRWRDALLCLIYPIAYLAYALAGGAVSGFYPYPFIDVDALGVPRVLMNAAALSAVVLLAGLEVVAAVRAIGRQARAADFGRGR